MVAAEKEIIDLASECRVVPTAEIGDGSCPAADIYVWPDRRIGKIIAQPASEKAKQVFARYYVSTPIRENLLYHFPGEGGLSKTVDLFAARGLTSDFGGPR